MNFKEMERCIFLMVPSSDLLETGCPLKGNSNVIERTQPHSTNSAVILKMMFSLGYHVLKKHH